MTNRFNSVASKASFLQLQLTMCVLCRFHLATVAAASFCSIADSLFSFITCLFLSWDCFPFYFHFICVLAEDEITTSIFVFFSNGSKKLPCIIRSFAVTNRKTDYHIPGYAKEHITSVMHTTHFAIFCDRLVSCLT